jgi:hypothetical protein
MAMLKLYKRIGAGAFGNVYLGTYGGTPVAVKRIIINGTQKGNCSLGSKSFDVSLSIEV